MFKNLISFSIVCQITAILLLVPSLSQAVEFGKLGVNSALGEALNLEVGLISVVPAELGTMSIGLASRSEFSKANIAYPENAESLKFQILEGANDTYYVTITTSIPVNDSFLHLLLSATWSRGKVVREYTALLDPPVFTGDSATPVEIPSSDDGSGQEIDSGLSSSDSTVSVVFPSTVHVQPGDTLSGIVYSLNMPGSLTSFQGYTAVLEANPDAFIDGNMNRMLAGAVLQIPTYDVISRISPQTALQQFLTHTEQYNQYLTDIGYFEQEDLAAGQPEEIAETQDEETAAVEPVSEEKESTEAALITESQETVAADSVDEALVVDVASEPVEPEPEPEVESSESDVQLDSEPDEKARLSIAQEVSDEALSSALEGKLGESEQIEVLEKQSAQAEEALLGSSAQSEEIKEELAEIQAQEDRVSTLIDIESSSLVIVQDQADSEGNESENALVVLDEAGPSDDGGETGLAAADSADDTQSAEESPINEIEDADAAIEEIAAAESPEVPAEVTQTETAGMPVGSEQVSETVQSEDVDTVVGHEAVTDDDTSAGDTATEKVVIDPTEEEPITVSGQAPQSSIMDSLAAISGGLGGYFLKIIAGLLVLIAVLYFYRQRKSQRELNEDLLEIESSRAPDQPGQTSFEGVNEAADTHSGSTNREAGPVVGGGLSSSPQADGAGVLDEGGEVSLSDVADPLEEADVYLAYNRDEQAIQVLEEAYDSSPERHDLAEKLLEIFHQQNDRIAFDALAGKLRTRLGAGPGPVWNKVAAMGKEVSPGNAWYDETDVDQNISEQLEYKGVASALPVDDTLFSEGDEQSTGKMDMHQKSKTALQLAKTYLQLGEKDIAKGYIEEVLSEGSKKQKAKAEKLARKWEI